MVGKLLNLKCRLVLDHLKIKPPPKAAQENSETASSSSAIDAAAKDPQLLAEPVVNDGEPPGSGSVDTVDAQQEQIPKPEELNEEFDTKAVYSHWKSKGRGSPGGLLEKSSSRFCRLDMNFIKENNIPSKFEVIQCKGRDSRSPETGPCAKRLKPDCTDKTDMPIVEGSVVEVKVNNILAVPTPSCNSPCKNEIKRSPAPPASTDEPDHKVNQPIPSSSSSFVTPVALSKLKLERVDKINFHCPESDVVAQPEEIKEDITGSILELEQDEISTPKGSRKGKLPKSPNFPQNQFWIKPEVLLEEMWEKKKALKTIDDEHADKFVFPTDPNVVLSPNTWQIPELINLKDQLNAVKSSLDLLPLEHWHAHTKKMNIAHLIVSYVKRYFNPEFSSQAWGKMFEILCSFDVIPLSVINEVDAIFNDKARVAANEKVPFDTVHLCEAPGAFISALNHFIKISYSDIDWNWLATTLNPYHENNDVGKMINDDRLILMSLEKWTFLEDKTGNILSNANFKSLLQAKTEKLDKVRENKTGRTERHVLLVTADGSIDCQMNPGEQESMVYHLQFGEIVTALAILEKGGTFVLKIFTFLEAATISHLYLLSCVFKEVHLYKPTTSKEGNSEVYVVCLQYLGEDAIASILNSKLIPNLETYGQLLEEGKLLLPLSAIPEFFIDRIKESARFFCEYQMKIIQRNASCFPCDTRPYHVMKPFRKEAAEQWIEWSCIKALHAKFRLFTGDADDFKMRNACHVDIRTESGCFAQKLIRESGTDIQKINEIKMELSQYDDWTSPQNQVVYGSVFKLGPIEFERPYKNIRCSRFCYGRVLTSREEVREILKRYMTDLQTHGLGGMNNICGGHSTKRIYESMNKSCDMHFKDFEVLCFSKLTWEYVTKSDFQQQKDDLTLLFKSIQEMGKDRSMFLCRFPMLTRMQVGIIFCLASVFEKVIIYGDPKKNVVGIMLHKFKGLSQPEDKNMFRCVNDVLDVLVDDEFNWPVLQVVPMKTILEFMPTEFLVKYNILLLCQDMQRTIGVAEYMIRSNDKANKKLQYQ